MTDDPWRTPDPKPPDSPPAYAPLPGYGPPPGYGPAPYGPPGTATYNPYNPYQAPLPKRGGYKRLLWILGTVGVLLLGGCGVGIYLVANSVSKNIGATNAFLRDVRDHRFSAAYQRLCPDYRAAVTEAEFTGEFSQAADVGNGVTSFDITSADTSQTVGSGGESVHTATGVVSFANGGSKNVTFWLQKSGGGLCIDSGFQDLLLKGR